MATATVITDAAGVATAVGVLFGAAQLLLSRSQVRTTFEDALSGQYRELIKPRLAAGLLESLSPDERDTVVPYYEYFDLCKEQVFLRMQGRVCGRTWKEWELGIRSNLSRGGIAKAWQIVSQPEAELEDFEELRLLYEAGFGSDPRTWNPVWRRILRREQGAVAEATRRRATARQVEPGELPNRHHDPGWPRGWLPPWTMRGSAIGHLGGRSTATILGRRCGGFPRMNLHMPASPLG